MSNGMYLRLSSLLLVFLSLTTAYRWILQGYQYDSWFLPRRVVVNLLVLGLGVLIQGAVIWLSTSEVRHRIAGRLSRWFRSAFLSGLGIAIIGLGATFLAFGQFGDPYLDWMARLWLFLQSVWWIGAILYLRNEGRENLPLTILRALLMGGFCFSVGSFLPKVSTHPFSLDWSETSRYYYASLFFAEQVYGVKAAWSPLHPSRYLLQAIPFLFHPLPLWVHRFWQVVLWIGCSAGTSWLLVRRLRLEKDRWLAWLYGYLFLMVGAVYYHLLVIPALLFAFCATQFDNNRKNIHFGIALLLASVWAGISRVNWLPMPAILFVTLYLLERPTHGQKIWRYLFAPFLISVASSLVGMLSSAAYVKLSGNPANYFTSSFTSDLLWQRLLPNPTYYGGILLPIFFVSFPVILTLYEKRLQRLNLGWLRGIGLAAILGVLFLVGVIVSVKIGGGSNLHNFDGYLVVLWLILYYFAWGRVKSENESQTYSPLQRAENFGFFGSLFVHREGAFWRVIHAWLVIAPLPFAIFQGGPVKTYPPERVEEALDALYSIVEKATDAHKEILFITERHLLTFGVLPNVPLVADYEKVWLMEMAMANHRQYLEKFYADLAKRRFAVIVSTQTYLSPQGDTGRFGDENRAWRKRVNRPVLCYYKPYLRFREFNFEILLPREQVQRRCR